MTDNEGDTMPDDAPSEGTLALAKALEAVLKPGAAPEAPAAPVAPPAAPEIPSAAVPPAAVAAATPAPGQLPEGLMSAAEVE
jgi:hypothetical protein